jgi:hypothetical protein
METVWEQDIAQPHLAPDGPVTTVLPSSYKTTNFHLDHTWSGYIDFVLVMRASTDNPIAVLCNTIQHICVLCNGCRVDDYWFDPSVLAMHDHIGCARVSPSSSDRAAIHALTMRALPDVVPNIMSYMDQEIRFHLPLLQRFAPGAVSASHVCFSIWVTWVSKPGQLKMVQRAWQIPVEVRPTIYRRWQWNWVSCMSAAGALSARIRLPFNYHIDELFVSMPAHVRPTVFKIRVNNADCMTWEHIEKIQTMVCADRQCYRLHLCFPDRKSACPMLNFSRLDWVSLDMQFEPANTAASFDMTLAASSYAMSSYEMLYGNQVIRFPDQ